MSEEERLREAFSKDVNKTLRTKNRTIQQLLAEKAKMISGLRGCSMKIAKLEAENAELKELLRKQQILTVEAVDIAREKEVILEKLEKVIFDVHNCEACGNRCGSHIDAWCDIVEIFMHELEKGGELTGGNSRENPDVGLQERITSETPKPCKHCELIHKMEHHELIEDIEPKTPKPGKQGVKA